MGAVGHIERYNPALQQARARIANGDLGEIYQITTRRQGPFPGRIADVGVILDLATHDIDLTAWVAQQPFTSVAARTAHRSGRPHEDLVAITGQLADGTVTNHLVNWLSPMKERVTVITGEKGALVADTLTADLTFYENGVVPTEWTRSPASAASARGTSPASPSPSPSRCGPSTRASATPCWAGRRHRHPAAGGCHRRGRQRCCRVGGDWPDKSSIGTSTVEGQ